MEQLRIALDALRKFIETDKEIHISLTVSEDEMLKIRYKTFKDFTNGKLIQEIPFNIDKDSISSIKLPFIGQIDLNVSSDV